MDNNDTIYCHYCGGMMFQADDEDDVFICNTCNAILDGGTWSDSDREECVRPEVDASASPCRKYACSVEILAMPGTLTLLEAVADKALLPPKLKTAQLKAIRVVKRKLKTVRDRDDRRRLVRRLKLSLLKGLAEASP